MDDILNEGSSRLVENGLSGWGRIGSITIPSQTVRGEEAGGKFWEGTEC